MNARQLFQSVQSKTHANGNPLPDGDYTLTFRLYDIVVGGTHLCRDMDGPPM